MYCTECGELCNAKDVDFGIGAYEYWGQRCVDRNIQTVSDCCEAEIRDYPLEEDDEEKNK